MAKHKNLNPGTRVVIKKSYPDEAIHGVAGTTYEPYHDDRDYVGVKLDDGDNLNWVFPEELKLQYKVGDIVSVGSCEFEILALPGQREGTNYPIDYLGFDDSDGMEGLFPADEIKGLA